MTIPGDSTDLTNWNRTGQSPCHVYRTTDVADIVRALAVARTHGLSVIPHGAGHSYTDAAFNTGGIVMDVTPMRRVLAWDPEDGIMRVEPGASLRDVIRVALPDGWWPPVAPSTAEATIGGCVAMNINGKNAWKCGSFGEHVRSLTILLPTEQMLTLSPKDHPQLFQAVVGSAGLLGIITSVTLQLQRIRSGYVDVGTRPAASFGEIFAMFEDEQSADFQEAWVDGFAGEKRLGRGIVTCATYSSVGGRTSAQSLGSRIPEPIMKSLARAAGTLCRPVASGGVHAANGLGYWWSKRQDREAIRHRSLFDFTFYPPAIFAGYQAALPQGTETFQAFVPRDQVEGVFTEIMRRSQRSHHTPLWCVIKRHRRDPFLLSYQVDGFSLELNYRVVPRTQHMLRKMLWEATHLAIEAGGRFYLAKDSLLTSALYRQSLGDAAVDAFLHLKRLYDPEMLFQSDLFRRVLRPSP
jgi:decaprenylphospho-beta-D-ribofuranose 2-oxidase